MTLPVSPEILLAMMRQERLTWIERRAEADDKIKTLDAQIAGASAVVEIHAKAASAKTDDAEQAFSDGFDAGVAEGHAQTSTEEKAD